MKFKLLNKSKIWLNHKTLQLQKKKTTIVKIRLFQTIIKRMPSLLNELVKLISAIKRIIT